MFEYLKNKFELFQPKYIRLNNRAFKLYDKGKLGEALKLYNKSLELNKDPLTYYDIGTVYADLKMLDDEIAAYENAINLGLDKYYVYYDYAVALIVKGKLEKAERMLLKVIDIKPNFAEAYNNLGNIYALENDHDKAISYFKKALELNKSFDYAYFNLFLALKEQNKIADAIQAINKAIEYNANNAEYYLELADTYIEMGESRKAKEICSKLMDINKNMAKKILDKI